MNIIQIFKQFPTQESCVKHLEKIRWGDKPICVYCSSTNTNPLVKELRHHCNKCCKSFSVTVNTIFHQTHVPLQKWFLLISLMQNAKKGLSSLQASRDIEVSQTSTWSMDAAGVAFFLYFRFKSVAKYMYKLLQSDKTHFTF